MDNEKDYGEDARAVARADLAALAALAPLLLLLPLLFFAATTNQHT
jgi:hypothetical protein